MSAGGDSGGLPPGTTPTFVSVAHATNFVEEDLCEKCFTPLRERAFFPETEVYGHRRRAESRPYCEECGETDYHRTKDSLSTADRYAALEALADHYRERGFEFDVDAGKQLINAAKSVPEYSGRDAKVLGEAIYVATRSYSYNQ